MFIHNFFFISILVSALFAGTFLPQQDGIFWVPGSLSTVILMIKADKLAREGSGIKFCGV
jgi:hypothetical protein